MLCPRSTYHWKKNFWHHCETNWIICNCSLLMKFRWWTWIFSISSVAGLIRSNVHLHQLLPLGIYQSSWLEIFFQIPPVMGQEIFKSDGRMLTDLWSQFMLYELTDVMRQQDDKDFALMLNRLRVKMRQDPLLPMDKEMLDSCLVTDDDQISDILHVYPTNKKVNQFTSEKLQKLDFPTIYIEAADLKTQSHGNRLRRKEPYSDRRSIVLPITLSLATGARVMLICNVDVHDGLANGVVGEIAFISPHQTRKCLTHVW